MITDRAMTESAAGRYFFSSICKSYSCNPFMHDDGSDSGFLIVSFESESGGSMYSMYIHIPTWRTQPCQLYSSSTKYWCFTGRSPIKQNDPITLRPILILSNIRYLSAYTGTYIQYFTRVGCLSVLTVKVLFFNRLKG